jgi:uncharacterized protein (TIGR01777 family)
MPKKIVITGATGLIGKKISETLINRGDELIIFTRSPEKAKQIIPGAKEYVKWNYNNPHEWKEKINGVDSVIHLAGENVMGKRWTDKYKNKILESRIVSTKNLVEVISHSKQKPESFISASAVGFYPYSETEEFTEDSKPGNHFLSNVTKQWEDETAVVEKYGVRCVNIRTGIVLDKNEGALAKMILPFKLFIGGPLGNGKQWFPWIHINDVVGIYVFALDNENITGVLNAVAPEFINMKSFCKNLGKVINRPSIFKVPSFVLNIVLGKGAEAVLSGSKIKPQRTLGFGYKFLFDNSFKALSDILK